MIVGCQVTVAGDTRCPQGRRDGDGDDLVTENL